jgi:hypothetical protein
VKEPNKSNWLLPLQTQEILLMQYPVPDPQIIICNVFGHEVEE